MLPALPVDSRISTLADPETKKKPPISRGLFQLLILFSNFTENPPKYNLNHPVDDLNLCLLLLW